MPKTESVLISVSIVVSAPVSDSLSEDAMVDTLQESFLDAIAERLGSSIATLKNEPWFEQDAGSSYHYLSPRSEFSEKNAGRCAVCGRWTSDCESPNFLIMLEIGKTVDGKLVCNECRISGTTLAAIECESKE